MIPLIVIGAILAAIAIDALANRWITRDYSPRKRMELPDEQIDWGEVMEAERRRAGK